VVLVKQIQRWLERTTPAAPSKERVHFLDGFGLRLCRAKPFVPLCGFFFFVLSVFFCAFCVPQDLWDSSASKEGKVPQVPSRRQSESKNKRQTLSLFCGMGENRGMWNIAVPWWELVLRSAVVYIFLLALLRLTGKRQVGQLAPFDLVLLLVLSNAVQNSMNAGDNSLIGGLIAAATLVGLNLLVGEVTYRSKKLEAVIEGRPQILIHNGKLFSDVMANARLTHHELDAALRQAACTCIEDVHSAILENNGSISVVARHVNKPAVAADATGGTPNSPVSSS
jgi:uncharacterized membrane protein YcaP (DUF421 family)